MSAYAKAIVAAAVGFVGPILTYLAGWLATSADWSWRSFGAIIVGSAITSLSAGGLTWAVPNRPKMLSAPTHGAHEA